MEKHCLHLYTGNGKGKTSAAMGLALRMLGHHQPVLIAQFLKDGTSGELAAFKALEGVTVFDGALMKGFAHSRTPQQLEEERQRLKSAVDALIELAHEIKPALTVLDELNVALAMGLVTKDDALRLIDAALQYGDTAVTGRYAPEYLVDKADYASRIEAVKHPFDEGLAAREGIEW